MGKRTWLFRLRRYAAFRYHDYAFRIGENWCATSARCAYAVLKSIIPKKRRFRHGAGRLMGVSVPKDEKAMGADAVTLRIFGDRKTAMRW